MNLSHCLIVLKTQNPRLYVYTTYLSRFLCQISSIVCKTEGPSAELIKWLPLLAYHYSKNKTTTTTDLRQKMTSSSGRQATLLLPMWWTYKICLAQSHPCLWPILGCQERTKSWQAYRPTCSRHFQNLQGLSLNRSICSSMFCSLWPWMWNTRKDAVDWWYITLMPQWELLIFSSK